MSVYTLISTEVPYISPLRTIRDGLKMMEKHLLECLPVVVEQTQQYVGIATYSQLYSEPTQKKLIDSIPLDNIHASETHNIINVLAIMSLYKYTILPFVDNQNIYKGCITQQAVIDEMSTITSANLPGGVIELESDVKDFSPAIIAGITENNSMKISSMMSQPHGAHGVRAIIKLNGNETSSVIQGLERQGYNIKKVHNGDSKYSNMLEEHYNALVRFMEV